MSLPVVSVIITSYQSGEMLKHAVNSVIFQDYPQIEIIICDDGSTDNETLDVLAQFERDGIMVIRHKINQGTVKNLLSGIDHSNAEWIITLAADDMLAKTDTISKLMARENQWVVGEIANNFKSKYSWLNNKEMITSKAYETICQDCFIPSSGSLYSRELIEKVGGFDDRYILVEDWPFFIKAIRLGLFPDIIDETTVISQKKGISGKGAGHSRIYQRDLICIMENEIIPYLYLLTTKSRVPILKLCQDKRSIYCFRFDCVSIHSKILWILTHIGVIVRKIKRSI